MGAVYFQEGNPPWVVDPSRIPNYECLINTLFMMCMTCRFPGQVQRSKNYPVSKSLAIEYNEFPQKLL